MMIRVIYANGAYDIVKGQMLDSMIERGDVAGFQRSEGWVVVGRDHVRQRSRQNQYPGPERRGGQDASKFVRW
jgi:hypothetical protein